MEDGEVRSDSGSGSRIIRVGTHALHAGSKTNLWGRLSQHRGVTKSGGGNHRGSIFRLLVGTALMAREDISCPTWGLKSSASQMQRALEVDLERRVSEIVGAMKLLWLPVDDLPGPASLRGYIERNAIALLSNLEKDNVDPPRADWLGLSCARRLVRDSGLWNQRHVNEQHDPAFLNRFDSIVADLEAGR